MPSITLSFSAGDKVRQVVKPFEGEVVKVRLSEENGTPEYLVAWTDDAGGLHERWFTDAENAIEAAPQP